MIQATDSEASASVSSPGSETLTCSLQFPRPDPETPGSAVSNEITAPPQLYEPPPVLTAHWEDSLNGRLHVEAAPMPSMELVKMKRAATPARIVSLAAICRFSVQDDTRIQQKNSGMSHLDGIEHAHHWWVLFDSRSVWQKFPQRRIKLISFQKHHRLMDKLTSSGGVQRCD